MPCHAGPWNQGTKTIRNQEPKNRPCSRFRGTINTEPRNHNPEPKPRPPGTGQNPRTKEQRRPGILEPRKQDNAGFRNQETKGPVPIVEFCRRPKINHVDLLEGATQGIFFSRCALDLTSKTENSSLLPLVQCLEWENFPSLLTPHLLDRT